MGENEIFDLPRLRQSRVYFLRITFPRLGPLLMYLRDRELGTELARRVQPRSCRRLLNTF